MQRLHRNRGGYHGERIDPHGVVAACQAAAVRHGWTAETLDPAHLPRPAFRRPATRPGAPRLYLSTGMHGDEPAGPLAALRLLETNRWPDAHLWLVPCLNPDGLRANTRENAAGIDVNRDYRNPASAEAHGHLAWLQRQPNFDLSLLLHEDWEAHGFYCYELNYSPRPSLAEAIVEAARRHIPIDASEVIDGRPAAAPGIIRPQQWPDYNPHQRPDWPEALWLVLHKTPLSYTLEAPSDWPLETRVNALVAATQAALERFDAQQP